MKDEIEYSASFESFKNKMNGKASNFESKQFSSKLEIETTTNENKLAIHDPEHTIKPENMIIESDINSFSIINSEQDYNHEEEIINPQEGNYSI